MSEGDLALRNKAVPFKGNWVSNAQIGNLAPSSLVRWDGDLYALDTGTDGVAPAAVNQIRILTPTKGSVIECYLTAIFKAPTNVGLSIKLAIGTFQSDNLTPTSSYSQSKIDADHLALTGQSAAYTCAANGTIIIDSVDLTRRILKYAQSGFNQDMFVLLICLSGILPNPSNGYALQKFQIDGSAQMGLIG